MIFCSLVRVVGQSISFVCPFLSFRFPFPRFFRSSYLSYYSLHYSVAAVIPLRCNTPLQWYCSTLSSVFQPISWFCLVMWCLCTAPLACSPFHPYTVVRSFVCYVQTFSLYWLIAFFFLLIKLRLTLFSFFVVPGGWDLVRNGSPRSGTLVTSQSSVMADPLHLFGYPRFWVWSLQPFLTSTPLIGQVSRLSPFYMVFAFFGGCRQSASM